MVCTQRLWRNPYRICMLAKTWPRRRLWQIPDNAHKSSRMTYLYTACYRIFHSRIDPCWFDERIRACNGRRMWHSWWGHKERNFLTDKARCTPPQHRKERRTSWNQRGQRIIALFLSANTHCQLEISQFLVGPKHWAESTSWSGNTRVGPLAGNGHSQKKSRTVIERLAFAPDNQVLRKLCPKCNTINAGAHSGKMQSPISG